MNYLAKGVALVIENKPNAFKLFEKSYE